MFTGIFRSISKIKSYLSFAIFCKKGKKKFYPDIILRIERNKELKTLIRPC